jgi:hypothetical protein
MNCELYLGGDRNLQFGVMYCHQSPGLASGIYWWECAQGEVVM